MAPAVANTAAAASSGRRVPLGGWAQRSHEGCALLLLLVAGPMATPGPRPQCPARCPRGNFEAVRAERPRSVPGLLSTKAGEAPSRGDRQAAEGLLGREDTGGARPASQGLAEGKLLQGGVVAGRWLGSRPETAVPGGRRFSLGDSGGPLGAASGRCLGGRENPPKAGLTSPLCLTQEVKSWQVLPPTLGLAAPAPSTLFRWGPRFVGRPGTVWSPLVPQLPAVPTPHSSGGTVAVGTLFRPVRCTGRGEGARPRPRSPRLMVFNVTAQAGSKHHASQPRGCDSLAPPSAKPSGPVCAVVQRSSDVSCSTV